MSAEEKKKHEHVTHHGQVAAKSAASQRRHNLEKNTLADSLNRVVQALKEGPSRSTWIVVGIVVAAVALYFVWNYFSKSSDEKSSARWYTAFRLFDGESVTAPADEKSLPLSNEAELEKFVKEHDGTVQAKVCRFYLARLAMARGEGRLGGLERDGALEHVRKAAGLYEKLAGETSDWPDLHQQALLGAGKAHEALGDFSQALKHYNQFVSDYSNPKSAFLDDATAGQERLKEGSDSRKELEALQARLSRK
jgi:tetratricopeptide (TPR) repeat protein